MLLEGYVLQICEGVVVILAYKLFCYMVLKWLVFLTL